MKKKPTRKVKKYHPKSKKENSNLEKKINIWVYASKKSMRARKEYMSIEDLFNFMREELRNCPGNAFIDRVLADLRKAMENRKFFKPEKFKEWFIKKNVIYRASPLAFLTKCGIADIDSGAFDKKIITGFAMRPLIETLRSKGVYCDTQGTTFLRLDIYLVYIYNHELMTLDEIREWVQNACDYIVGHSKNADEFKELLFKSRSIKMLKLPYSELEADVKKADDDLSSLTVDGNPLESETFNEKETNKVDN